MNRIQMSVLAALAAALTILRLTKDPDENGRPNRLVSSHDGRGHEPVTVVGSSRSLVAVSILPTPRACGGAP